MAETEKKQRDFGLDLARAAAGVLTLSVHFFLNNGFYYVPVLGKGMLASCVVRMACMTCVPLFLLLTGYLCVNRRWGAGYYRKLLPVLFTYLLTGAICVVFRFVWMGEHYTLRGVVKLFTTYLAAPYSWYIEMYIGLFLLSPFVNAAWHSLERNGKRALVLTLVGMTGLTTLVNQLGHILPAWWEGVYPLAYYALGAWLRENPIRTKGWKLLLGWLGLSAVVGVKSYFDAKGGVYIWIAEDQWGSLTLMIQAVLLFSCLRQLKGEKVPAPVHWLVDRGAKLALSMYLISFIPDMIIYPVLSAAVPSIPHRLWYMPLVVPVVVICSGALAQLVDWAVEAMMRMVPTKES